MNHLVNGRWYRRIWGQWYRIDRTPDGFKAFSVPRLP